MNRNLFGQRSVEQASIALKLFCDECKSAADWLYIGILIVPEKLETVLLQNLLNKRCGHPDGNRTWGRCSPECARHKNNNTEAHYVEVDKSKDKYFVARRWLDYLLHDTGDIYFYILGIDLNKLDRSQFGTRKQSCSIYNRFFRTAILKSVKSYFHKYKSITIENIYHDGNRALETDNYFPWHSVFFIDNLDNKVTFKSKKIDFIESDHRKSKSDYSHFIQFVDVLLGCVNNCIDHTSHNADKERLAETSLPLVERLIKKPNNRNSRYKYFGRQKIEFFPKYDLKNVDKGSLEYGRKKIASFYCGRTLQIMYKNQLSLGLLNV